MAGNLGLGDNPSIPKLVEFLRTAIRSRHVDDAKQILICREEKWKVEMELLKEENDALRLDKISINNEMEELKKLIFLVNRDRMETKERERKLLEDRDNGRGFGKEEAAKVIVKIIELENGKSAAEAEAARWKSKVTDLEMRLSRLENDAILLGLELEHPVVSNINRVLRENGVVPENGDCSFPDVRVETDVPNCSEYIERGFGANCAAPEKGNSSFVRMKVESDVSELNQNTCLAGASTSHPSKSDIDDSQEAGRNGHGRRVFVEISDSDSDCEVETTLPEKQTASEKSPQASDSIAMGTEGGSVTLKRKQDSEIQNNCTDYNTQPSKFMRLQELGRDEEQMAVEKPSPAFRSEYLLHDVEDSDSFSDSDIDQSIDEYVSSVKNNRKWKDEIEMVIAFRRDTELCLDAVCALYRQENTPKGSTSSKHRGFIPSDKLRGTELAKFLIDRDQQGKRRKSINELMEHDEKGVEDCRRIASISGNYMQLFDVYKNREDPFFPSLL